MPSPKQIRIEHKLIASARKHLRGESGLAIFRGQTVVSPIFAALTTFDAMRTLPDLAGAAAA